MLIFYTLAKSILIQSSIKIILLLVYFLGVFSAHSQVDSILKPSNFKRIIKSITPSGQVVVGYDYGFLPFLVTVAPPQGNFKTEGYLQIDIKDLPFNASYYYSSLGTVSGLNNHFTINYDADRFIQKKKEDLLASQMERIGKIDSLKQVRQKYKTKLDYLYLLKDGKINLPKKNLSNFESPLDPLSLPNIQNSLDSLPYPDVQNPLDTLSTASFQNPLDTLTMPAISDSLDTMHISQGSEVSQFQDSLSQVITKYQDAVGKVESTIGAYQKLNNMNVDSLAKSRIPQPNSFQDKLTNVFKGVKKFNIGLTYPNYSQFLIARTPIRGINTEYQINNIYVAFTHGKTVNNIFLTNSVLQNNLNAARNLYNFFDFNNIRDGRRVTSLKLGYGAKETSHIHVGVLYGLGKVSYQDSSQLFDSEKNLVGEIDLRFKSKKYHTIDFLAGRSAIQVNEINQEGQNELFNRMIDFNDRTYGLLSRYQLNLKTTKLKLTFRLVDPFYRSFGVAFIKSDNIRYEVKVKQKFGKKLDVNFFYRKESDNLLGIYSYQNVISSYGAGIGVRPTKNWLFKLDFRPLFLDVNQKETTQNDTLNFNSENYIANFVVNYNNRIKDTYFFATGVYSYYQLTLSQSLNVYQNLNLNLSIQHKDKWSYDLIYNNYRTSDVSAIPLASILETSYTYKFQKINVKIIGKSSFTQNKSVDFGYGLKGSYKISNLFSFQLSGEKVVLGDFYNTVYQNNLNSFPYFFSTGIKMIW